MASASPGRDRRRFLLAAAAVLPSACAAPRFLAPPAIAPGAPRVALGQQWRYREINRYNGQVRTELAARVVQLDPQLRVSLTDADGKRRDDEVYAGAWNIVQDPTYDYTQVYARPVPLVPAPPALGRCAYTSVGYVATVEPELRLSWVERRCAVGWERVAVPAGEFLALRIERIVQFRHVDFRREDATRTDTLWYAPQVDRWVQREWTGTYFWAGMRRDAPLREAWVLRQLIEHRRG